MSQEDAHTRQDEGPARGSDDDFTFHTGAASRRGKENSDSRQSRQSEVSHLTDFFHRTALSLRTALFTSRS